MIDQTFGVAIFGTTNLQVIKETIDWRIITYELYSRTEELFFLVAEIPVEDSWTEDGIFVYKEVVYFTKDEIADGKQVTLNFNYGLSHNVFVGTEAQIHSEASHKGRTYFVNGSNKVLQSHISGTGRQQADSFPYDEALRFGFFETFKSESNKGVAITPQDELAILTSRKAYI